MDTLFSTDHIEFDHHHYHNNSTTSSSSPQSQIPLHFNFSSPRQCFQPTFMDDDTSSSSSQQNNIITYRPQLNLRATSSQLLLAAARAFADKDTMRLHHYLYTLNSLASPYGDTDQKLAAYFLRALFALITDSGPRTSKTLAKAAESVIGSFEVITKTMLKFQELSPWTTFGHVAANGAILEAFEGETHLHIVDFSNTYCTQWPTLLEALANRPGNAPRLRITAVTRRKPMEEIASRMEKFARLMGVPFEFRTIFYDHDLLDIGVKTHEALAVNCINTLRSVDTDQRRDGLLSLFRGMRPRVVTIVEEEADLDMGDFMCGFENCVSWFGVYFESLDECFLRKASNERLVLEKGAGREVVELVACGGGERREKAGKWARRIGEAGFWGAGFSEEVCDDVGALLRRYRNGNWSMRRWCDNGMFLCWKERPLVWVSAWKT